METFNYWIQAIISILSGLAVVIPLLVSLIKYIKVSAKEKNWTAVLTLVAKLMTEAEFKFDTGEERKAFVIAELKTMASTIDYDIDWDVINTLIDTLCDMSKQVNTK